MQYSILDIMKVIANIKLKPSAEQATTLRATLERCNEACNWISKRAYSQKTFGQYSIHHMTYKKCRAEFGLSAQVTVRSIAKVADSYKRNRKTPHKFRKHSAQPYDNRIFRFCDNDIISIWTLEGRQKVPFVCGEHQRKLLPHRKGEVELMFIRDKWYIGVICDVDTPKLITAQDILGIDLGIVNLAVDSDGKTFSGKEISKNYRKHDHRRRNLQKKKTRSAKRKLKKISGNQKRFQKDMNHCISKAIVQKAQRSGSMIALENLKGIRSRIKARRRQRGRLHNWAFAQLRSFIEYKARLAGVPVSSVDPANTSRYCPSCGHTEKFNRKSRDLFECRRCGFAGLADHIAALNIRARAAINQPMVTSECAIQHVLPQLQTSPFAAG